VAGSQFSRLLYTTSKETAHSCSKPLNMEEVAITDWIAARFFGRGMFSR
jgi:hypothetical protein